MERVSSTLNFHILNIHVLFSGFDRKRLVGVRAQVPGSLRPRPERSSRDVSDFRPVSRRCLATHSNVSRIIPGTRGNVTHSVLCLKYFKSDIKVEIWNSFCLNNPPSTLI